MNGSQDGLLPVAVPAPPSDHLLPYGDWLVGFKDVPCLLA